MKKKTAVVWGLIGMLNLSIILAVIIKDSIIQALFAGLSLICLISATIITFAFNKQPNNITKKESKR